MFLTNFLNSQELPLVVEPAEPETHSDLAALVSLVQDEQKFFRTNLLKHGALLFRGFAVVEAADLEQFVRAFSNKELLNYAGGVSPRVELGGNVYTSTEYPSQYMLSLHNEMSYSDRYPSEIYFCCLIAPETGGETPIADSRTILNKIDVEIVEQFKQKKIRYDRNLYAESGSGYAWQDAFETADKAVVKNYCEQFGIDFEWKGDGRLRLSQVRPATVVHPVTGEETWFNQAEGFHPSALDRETYRSLIEIMSEEDFRLNSRFGDGTPIDIRMLKHIRDVIEQEMIVFPWREGDILVLDNLLVAHGRMPFEGPRKIILAMT